MHFPIQPVRRTPFQKTQITNMICKGSLIHRKSKSVPYPVSAKSCVPGVKFPKSIFKGKFYKKKKLLFLLLSNL